MTEPTPASHPHPEPVMWSPTALRARLEAQQALDVLPRRAHGITAEARAGIRRIIGLVERRRLSLPAATAQLRRLTLRLRAFARDEAARRGPRTWEMLAQA